VSVSVCLLLDEQAELAVRGLWRRLEHDGVPTLLSHTHGRHLPHLTLVSVADCDRHALRGALTALPPAAPTAVRFDALGLFPRSRSWLTLAVSDDLLRRQRAAAEAVASTGALPHRHYLPGQWLPHLTLAPRLPVRQVGTLAERVFEVLPLIGTLSSAALVDTSTGVVDLLPHLV
jgi:2'-5' RNA ligase